MHFLWLELSDRLRRWNTGVLDWIHLITVVSVLISPNTVVLLQCCALGKLWCVWWGLRLSCFIFSTTGVPFLLYFCLFLWRYQSPLPQAPVQVNKISPDVLFLEIPVISCPVSCLLNVHGGTCRNHFSDLYLFSGALFLMQTEQNVSKDWNLLAVFWKWRLYATIILCPLTNSEDCQAMECFSCRRLKSGRRCAVLFPCLDGPLQSCSSWFWCEQCNQGGNRYCVNQAKQCRTDCYFKSRKAKPKGVLHIWHKPVLEEINRITWNGEVNEDFSNSDNLPQDFHTRASVLLIAC